MTVNPLESVTDTSTRYVLDVSVITGIAPRFTGDAPDTLLATSFEELSMYTAYDDARVAPLVNAVFQLTEVVVEPPIIGVLLCVSVRLLMVGANESSSVAVNFADDTPASFVQAASLYECSATVRVMDLPVCMYDVMVSRLVDEIIQKCAIVSGSSAGDVFRTVEPYRYWTL